MGLQNPTTAPQGLSNTANSANIVKSANSRPITEYTKTGKQTAKSRRDQAAWDLANPKAPVATKPPLAVVNDKAKSADLTNTFSVGDAYMSLSAESSACHEMPEGQYRRMPIVHSKYGARYTRIKYVNHITGKPFFVRLGDLGRFNVNGEAMLEHLEITTETEIKFADVIEVIGVDDFKERGELVYPYTSRMGYNDYVTELKKLRAALTDPEAQIVIPQEVTDAIRASKPIIGNHIRVHNLRFPMIIAVTKEQAALV